VIAARSKVIARDQTGAAAVEFALIAPVLLMTVLGLFDLGHMLYTNSMMQGAIQQAARNSTLEGAAGSAAALDAIVTRAVKNVSPKATLSFERKVYSNFIDVGRPEDFTDSPKSLDGICNNGEVFEDANGNGKWDADRGDTGFGSGRDAVLYTVRVSYPRLFPVAKFIPGQSNTTSLETATVLRNQPYSLQANTVPKTDNCP
jgi:Flp pilus assembly pilin Flp